MYIADSFLLLLLGVVVSGVVILGFIIYYNNKQSQTNISFLKFSIVTALWGAVNYLTYTAQSQITVLWLVRVLLFCAVVQAYYFFKLSYVFPKKDFLLNKKTYLLLKVLVSLVALLSLTPMVFSGVRESDSIPAFSPIAERGILLFAIVAVGLVVSGLVFLYKKFLDVQDANEKAQYRLVFFGAGLMFGLIIIFNFIFPNIFKNVEFIPYGAIFVFPFILFTSYAIHRHKLFNLRIASVGFVAFILTIFSFFNVIYAEETSQIVLNATFFLVILLGTITLIRTILREIEQKEELAELLEQRESLEHLISHKVKGSFTRSKYIFAEMLENSFGELPDKLREIAKGGLAANNSGIQTVDLILNSFNPQNGVVQFEMKKIDFRMIVENVVEEKRGPIEDKGLAFEVDIKDGEYHTMGDETWLKEVVNNLVENAFRYTKEGKITVYLSNINNKILFCVADTGVGITPEDKTNLFKQGGRGKESLKINTDSTGYGLYSVKLILDQHKGRVWVESEGENKGSKFCVELNIAK